MFNVHLQIRRLLCRIGFMLFCAAPTIGVIGWMLLIGRTVFTESEQAACRTALSSQLGLQVDFEQMSRTSAGALLLTNVKISDPETNIEILRAHSIEATTGQRGIVLVCSFVEANLDQLAADWSTLHDGLIRRRIALSDDLFIVANRVSLVRRGPGDEPERAETFTDVSCEFLRPTTGALFTAKFRRANDPSAELAELRMQRTANATEQKTKFSLDTHRTPLPCWLLADYSESLRLMGDDCEFNGKLWLETARNDDWQGDIGGRFTGVDLERYVASRFPHRLSGRAELILDPPAKFRRGRLIEATGVLQSPRGVIGRELLKAAGDQLGLNWKRDSGRNGGYTELAMGFRITTDGLSLTGLCQTAGALVVDAGGPLLTEQDRQPVPVVNLVNALVPSSDVQVPATEETSPLLRALPIPSVAPQPPQKVEGPRASIRLQR